MKHYVVEYYGEDGYKVQHYFLAESFWEAVGVAIYHVQAQGLQVSYIISIKEIEQ